MIVSDLLKQKEIEALFNAVICRNMNFDFYWVRLQINDFYNQWKSHDCQVQIIKVSTIAYQNVNRLTAKNYSGLVNSSPSAFLCILKISRVRTSNKPSWSKYRVFIPSGIEQLLKINPIDSTVLEMNLI